MKVLSIQSRLDQKKQHTDLQKAAKALGGVVNANGQVVLDKEIAIALSQLFAQLEEQLTADRISLLQTP